MRQSHADNRVGFFREDNPYHRPAAEVECEIFQCCCHATNLSLGLLFGNSIQILGENKHIGVVAVGKQVVLTIMKANHSQHQGLLSVPTAKAGG